MTEDRNLEDKKYFRFLSNNIANNTSVGIGDAIGKGLTNQIDEMLTYLEARVELWTQIELNNIKQK